MEVRNKHPSVVMLLHGHQYFKTLCAYRFRGVADSYPMVDILYINIAPVWKSGTSCLMEAADLYPPAMVLLVRETMEVQKTQC